jgi:hypothetical protein
VAAVEDDADAVVQPHPGGPAYDFTVDDDHQASDGGSSLGSVIEPTMSHGGQGSFSLLADVNDALNCSKEHLSSIAVQHTLNKETRTVSYNAFLRLLGEHGDGWLEDEMVNFHVMLLQVRLRSTRVLLLPAQSCTCVACEMAHASSL